jgi:heat shock protein HtpX
MIIMIGQYLIFLMSILVGPPIAAMLVIVVLVIDLVAALALRHSFRGRTVTLLGMLGLMVGNSLLLVLDRTDVDDLLRLSPSHLSNSPLGPYSTLHTMNLAIALVGIFAALSAAVFISFWKPRRISKEFLEPRLLETPVELRESVDRLASRAGIVSPEVWLIDSGLPSAFTVKANHRYSVAVSVGLLESMDDKETEASIAHEIAHLKNNDFTVRFLATLAKVALFTRPLSYLIEPAVYRAREFLADTTAANLIGGPDALISALSKLKDSSVAASSLFHPMPKCNLSARKALFGIFEKHPDLETRIKMLEEMKRA